jgi:altronate dehydratase small subunit
MAKALKINAGDNVAVVLADVKAGEEVGVMTDTDVVQIRAQQDIAFGHKIALADLTVDQPIIKYGEEIGRAQKAIGAGDWIHSHNLYCRRGRENHAEQ